MPSPSQVKDTLTEKNGIITNILMVIVIGVGGFFGDRIVNKLDELNQTINGALTEIAVIREINLRQEDDIKRLKTWRDGASTDINQLKSWKESQTEHNLQRR